MIAKEEIADILESDFWKEVEADLLEERADAKEQLCGLDFSTSTVAIDAIVRQAIGYQKTIEVIDHIFDKISEMKEESE